MKADTARTQRTHAHTSARPLADSRRVTNPPLRPHQRAWQGRAWPLAWFALTTAAVGCPKAWWCNGDAQHTAQESWQERKKSTSRKKKKSSPPPSSGCTHKLCILQVWTGGRGEGKEASITSHGDIRPAIPTHARTNARTARTRRCKVN